MSLRRTIAIARKEFLHITRDPRSLGIALAIPMLMLVLFGYALSLDVDRIPTLVYDRDQTPESRALIERFRGSVYFTIAGNVNAYPPVELAVDRGEVLIGLVIPHNYAHDLHMGKSTEVQLLIDGSDSNTAGIALNYARALLEGHSASLRVQWQNQRGGGKIDPPADAQMRVFFNSELKSKNYIVPGLIAVILMIIAALLTSLTIAREWENGTMEELLSTPVRPAELVLGKLSAYFVLGLVDTLTSILAGVFVFDVPLRGSVLLLMFSSFVFLFGALCWGILLSAMSRSQLVAYQLGLLTSFLPAFLLSGFIYATDSMPLGPRIVSYIVPARYFITLLKGIYLKGVGLDVLWYELLFLFFYAALVFFFATRRLRQKIA